MTQFTVLVISPLNDTWAGYVQFQYDIVLEIDVDFKNAEKLFKFIYYLCIGNSASSIVKGYDLKII